MCAALVCMAVFVQGFRLASEAPFWALGPPCVQCAFLYRACARFCTGPVYSWSGRCPALRGLSPLWLLGLRPMGAWSWRLLLPLRVGGASLRRASVFSCPALVRVLGLAFSVAGGRRCPALRFSVACPRTRTLLCLTRKKEIGYVFFLGSIRVLLVNKIRTMIFF